MHKNYDAYHSRVLEWLRLEWPYQTSKFTEESELERTATLKSGTPLKDDAWKQAIDNYYLQAMLIGVDNSKGRQRLAKALATMVAELTFVLAEFGDLPEPGHSSTDDLVEPWLSEVGAAHD